VTNNQKQDSIIAMANAILKVLDPKKRVESAAAMQIASTLFASDSTIDHAFSRRSREAPPKLIQAN